MNSLTLIGGVLAPPVYHCTAGAQDLCRFQLVTQDRRGKAHVHHCMAWGPAALDLHAHLREGEQFLVRGELLYRTVSVAGVQTQRPYVLVRKYTYLSAHRDRSNKPLPAVRAAASASVRTG